MYTLYVNTLLMCSTTRFFACNPRLQFLEKGGVTWHLLPLYSFAVFLIWRRQLSIFYHIFDWENLQIPQIYYAALWDISVEGQTFHSWYFSNTLAEGRAQPQRWTLMPRQTQIQCTAMAVFWKITSTGYSRWKNKMLPVRHFSSFQSTGALRW